MGFLEVFEYKIHWLSLQLTTTSLLRIASPRVVNQDLPHGSNRCVKQLAPVFRGVHDAFAEQLYASFIY